MNGRNRSGEGTVQPGVWSSDDYIRTWAAKRYTGQGECFIPLQSLHDFWVAKVSFDQPGRPVERLLNPKRVNKRQEGRDRSDRPSGEDD